MHLLQEPTTFYPRRQEYTNITEPVIRIDASYCRLKHVCFYNYALFNTSEARNMSWSTLVNSFKFLSIRYHYSPAFYPLVMLKQQKQRETFEGLQWNQDLTAQTILYHLFVHLDSIIWNDLIPGTDSKCQYPEQLYSKILWGKYNFKIFWNIFIKTNFQDITLVNRKHIICYGDLMFNIPKIPIFIVKPDTAVKWHSHR